MTERTATGAFEVKLLPIPGDGPVGGMTIDKTFQGDLSGQSRGMMLAVRTDVEGSAGYVAMERVTGTLAGRRGSFALQHSGVRNRGAPSLNVVVVPDSGTEDLKGLVGRMDIVVTGSRHEYSFSYTLPE